MKKKSDPFCRDCAKYPHCTMRFLPDKSDRCPYLQEEDAVLHYRNSEGYNDPTCFIALCNVERERKRKAARERAEAQKRSAQVPSRSKPRIVTHVEHYNSQEVNR